MNAYETPLLDRLRSVPKDARCVLEEHLSAAFYPVGLMCHQAADRIAELEKENKHLLMVHNYIGAGFK